MEEVNSLRMASKASLTVWGVISGASAPLASAGCAAAGKRMIDVAAVIDVDIV